MMLISVIEKYSLYEAQPEVRGPLAAAVPV